MRTSYFGNQVDAIQTIEAARNKRTVAFIDGVNLHKGILGLGWKLDYRRFRAYLTDRYQVGRAYLFHGYLHENRQMYRSLTNWGYLPVFRPTCRGSQGEVKGNCDTELALRAIIGCYENRYDKAVLVSGDGDFASVTSFLASRGKLQAIVAPSYSSCSRLLKQSRVNLALLESLRTELEYLPDLERDRYPGPHNVK